MKIYFVIASLHGHGGTVRVATLLANHLSQRYDITILSQHCADNTYKLFDKVTDIKFKGNNSQFLFKARKYIKDNRPDIVIVHTMSKLTPALLLIGLQANRIWSLEHISYEFHSTFYKYLRRLLYNKLDKVITLTQSDASYYRHFNSNVAVIPNITPLPIKTNPEPSDSKAIISIGRLTYQKGYDLLIEAWRDIESHYHDWALQIYGEGEDKETLQYLINKYTLKNIKLMGTTDNVIDVYDNAAFYVMSSRYEGFPMVLLEAHSRGLPIVSFDCPSGPAEIINDGKTGYLVSNGNINELSNRIRELIENHHTREVFAQTALISAFRFTSENIMNQWIDLIESVP